MDTAASQENISLNRHIAEVRSTWGDGNDSQLPFKVKALLEKLLTSTSPQEPWIAKLIREGLLATELHRDQERGFILMGHVHEKGHGNSPHDHGPGWVLYGVYHGAVEITAYQRMDDGKVPGQARLEKKGIHRLTPGRALPYLPGEIHSTLAVEHSVVLRFLSYDLNQVNRNFYDLAMGTVQTCLGRCYLP
jgi:hypothetical protein